MFRWLQSSLIIAGLAFVSAGAQAFPLRSPQVPFNFAPLQGYLNLVDSGINVATDQLDAQLWSVAITGNTDFTLMLRTPIAQGYSVGVYNGINPRDAWPPASTPPPRETFQVFPPGAVPGWFATLHFGDGDLIVTMFDEKSVLQGQTVYSGVHPNSFGFYTQSAWSSCWSGHNWFSQDILNGDGIIVNFPQVLFYASNDLPGDYWVCFEACRYEGGPSPFDPGASVSTFDGVVINVQSMRPSPTSKPTWGQVKDRYRK